MDYIKKIPIPIAGLMLALASLGNHLASYSIIYKHLFMIPASIIAIALTLKACFFWPDVKEKLKDPVIASVLPTFNMGLMLIATYIIPLSFNLAIGLWYIAIILKVIIIAWFTKNHILNFDLEKVYPSFFIVYAGIVVASITSISFNAKAIGYIIFWVGLIPYLAILPVVIYRLIKLPDIPKKLLPTIAIFAAPANLCLAGYITTAPVKSTVVLYFLIGLGLLTYFYVLIYLDRLLRVGFYPSASSFTFPMVISAIAMKKTHMFFTKMNYNASIIFYIYIIQLIIALILVAYVLIKYLEFIFKKKPT